MLYVFLAQPEKLHTLYNQWLSDCHNLHSVSYLYIPLYVVDSWSADRTAILLCTMVYTADMQHRVTGFSCPICILVADGAWDYVQRVE